MRGRPRILTLAVAPMRGSSWVGRSLRSRAQLFNPEIRAEFGFVNRTLASRGKPVQTPFAHDAAQTVLSYSGVRASLRGRLLSREMHQCLFNRRMKRCSVLSPFDGLEFSSLSGGDTSPSEGVEKLGKYGSSGGAPTSG